MCDGGLGNRLGSLFGGLYYANLNNRIPKIYWPQNNWCGCKFDDLFDVEIESTNISFNESIQFNKNSIFVVHDFSQIKNIVPIIMDHIDPTNLTKYANIPNDIFYYHNIIPPFFLKENVLDLIKNLTIKSEIKNIVDDYIFQQKEKKQVINGLHIRKTDFKNHLNESVYENLILLKKDELFFLCSDDKKTEDKFLKFSNVITFSKKEYPQKLIEGDWNDRIVDPEGRVFNFNVSRSRQASIEAFIDMLILSKTNIIETNKNSTFFQFANYYGVIK